MIDEDLEDEAIPRCKRCGESAVGTGSDPAGPWCPPCRRWLNQVGAAWASPECRPVLIALIHDPTWCGVGASPYRPTERDTMRAVGRMELGIQLEQDSLEVARKLVERGYFEQKAAQMRLDIPEPPKE